MKVAVRYYSRSGNTRTIANAMAEALGVKALSVDDPEAAIDEDVDLLLIGGGLYARRLDKALRDYLQNLDSGKIGEAVCFSTASISRHGIVLLTDALEEKGIEVVDSFYCKGKEAEQKTEEAKSFTKKLIG